MYHYECWQDLRKDVQELNYKVGLAGQQVVPAVMSYMVLSLVIFLLCLSARWRMILSAPSSIRSEYSHNGLTMSKLHKVPPQTEYQWLLHMLQ